MQFIKKLVILTGGNLRGTLMLEKNSFGVWCRLNIFGELPGESRLVVLSGDELFVMKIEPNSSSVKFELGELDYEQIHAAVVGEQVIMYGSNCAVKLSPNVILRKVKGRDETALKQASYITFSSANQKIDDFFKEIVPPQYNDFAIAEKNFYPAYVSLVEQSGEEGEVGGLMQEFDKQEGLMDNMDMDVEEVGDKNEVANDVAALQEQVEIEQKSEERPLPHVLERKYLSLITDGVATKKVGAFLQKEQMGIDEREVMQVAAQSEAVAKSERKVLKSFAESGRSRSGRRATYYERSSEQIERLIATNERYGVVERLIPGSKFVKIHYDQKRFYIVGVIGKDYICYGVPGVFSAMPPEPLAGYAKWLPLGRDNVGGEGFWMMYQDGVTGETIKN